MKRVLAATDQVALTFLVCGYFELLKTVWVLLYLRIFRPQSFTGLIPQVTMINFSFLLSLYTTLCHINYVK